MNEEKIVCIIEDNKPIRQLFAAMFKKANIETEFFSNGKDAIEWITNHNPSVVVTDLLLPDIHGSEITKYVKEVLKRDNVSIIAMSGLTHTEYESKFKDFGIDSFLSKPVNMKEMIELVTKYLNK